MRTFFEVAKIIFPIAGALFMLATPLWAEGRIIIFTEDPLVEFQAKDPYYPLVEFNQVGLMDGECLAHVSYPSGSSGTFEHEGALYANIMIDFGDRSAAVSNDDALIILEEMCWSEYIN